MVGVALTKRQTRMLVVEDHLGLVARIARRYARNYQGHHTMDLEDLIQEGTIGLMRAIEKFDDAKGCKFSTYAVYWIRQAIGQAIENESRIMRLPSPIWQALRRLVRAQAVLWQQKQREPSLDDLAKELRLEREEVLALLHLQQEPVSLEQPIYSEDGNTLLEDLLEAPDDTRAREQQTEVADLLKYLTPQERQVIETRYQLGQTANAENIPLPYMEVGRQLGMTPGLVKTMEERAFMKMRFWAERGDLFAMRPSEDARSL